MLFGANALNNVTVSEYTRFLNVMAQEDPHSLYDQKMGEESGVPSIQRLGTPGNYSYRFNEGQEEESVMFVDLRSAMRFCNWKENGEQEDPATMEYGVYEFNGDELVAVRIDDTTNYFLPSEQDEKFSAMEGICLRLGSLEEPASWLRSNQVVFHLKGRLENMRASLSHEEQTSLEQDAGYVLATVAGIAAVATCFKYRDGCYPGRAGYERIPDRDVETRQREMTANGSGEGGGGDASLAQRGNSQDLHVRERNTSSAPTAALNETQEQLFKKEAQSIIDQQILPRTQMTDRAFRSNSAAHDQIQLALPFKDRVTAVRVEGEKYIQFLKNNFEKIFEYQKRTDELGKLMEPYMEKLAGAVCQQMTTTILDRATSFRSGLLDDQHADIMQAAQKYCSDFDASWTKALEATEKQHECFAELQIKETWINTTFPNLVREKEAEVNSVLREGAIGEMSGLRISAIKKFFDKTFKEEFAAGRQDLTRLVEAAAIKVPGWYQQVEALHFWDDTRAEATMEEAQALMQVAYQKTETLWVAFNDWNAKTERVIARAEQRYDAVNHSWPHEEELSITAEQHALMIKAVNDVNVHHEVISHYPSEAKEQCYYQQWIQSQYNKIQQALCDQRSYFSIDTYTSPVKGTLPENEKRVLRYFLNAVDSSPVDFIRAKAAALRKELDPDSDESDDSDD